MCLCTCLYTCLCTYPYTCPCTCLYTCLYICLHICLYTCLYTCPYTCLLSLRQSLHDDACLQQLTNIQTGVYKICVYVACGRGLCTKMLPNVQVVYDSKVWSAQLMLILATVFLVWPTMIQDHRPQGSFSATNTGPSAPRTLLGQKHWVIGPKDRSQPPTLGHRPRGSFSATKARESAPRIVFDHKHWAIVLKDIARPQTRVANEQRHRRTRGALACIQKYAQTHAATHEFHLLFVGPWGRDRLDFDGALCMACVCALVCGAIRCGVCSAGRAGPGWCCDGICGVVQCGVVW